MLKDLAFSCVRAPASDFITTELRLAFVLIKGKLAPVPPANGESPFLLKDGVIVASEGGLGAGGFLHEE